MYVLETNWEFQLRLRNVISESQLYTPISDSTPNLDNIIFCKSSAASSCPDNPVHTHHHEQQQGVIKTQQEQYQ